MRIGFLRLAITDLTATISYYNEQSEGLGFEFAAEVNRTLERIFSFHKSGVSHIRFEEKAEFGKETPIVLQSGEAGKPFNGRFICASLKDLGCAVSICTTVCCIDSPGRDFQEFKRKPRECFVIDKNQYFGDIDSMEIGVWAVPERNKFSFEFNNQGLSKELIYKVSTCEPQIWIYTKPFA